jgi:hypothetical protein
MENGIGNEIRIVEAIVNGVSQWRVYINQELRFKFATEEQAKHYVTLFNRDKK